jgi:hypothetical protein
VSKEGLRSRLALGDVALIGGAESGSAESGSAELLHSGGSAEIVLTTHATRQCLLAVGSAGKGIRQGNGDGVADLDR